MKAAALLFVVSVLGWACGGSSSPTMPTPGSSPSAGNMAGTWAGTSADSSGQEKMTWTITQNGGTVSGTANVSDTGRGMMGNATMTGTVSGSTITFHMTVPNGGFSGMMSSCSMAMDGQATISDDGRTMTGTYSGTMNGMMSGGMMGQSCGGAMNGGHFTLTR